MNVPNLRLSLALGLLLACLVSPSIAADVPAVPLHERIDSLIDATRVGPAIALANDAEFLRRVSLDLTGMPPSTADLRTFLADTNPEKRKAVVDRLLESPLFERHLATTLDVMLMERRPSQKIVAKDWEDYLLKTDPQRRRRRSQNSPRGAILS